MKKSKHHIIIILLVLSIALGIKSQSFHVDIGKTIIQSNSQWTRIKLNIQDKNSSEADPSHGNKQEKYQITYDVYPEGWNQVLDYIYLPKSELSINRKYPCRVRIKDTKGAEMKMTVIFIVSSGKVYMANTILPYDQVFQDDFFNTGIFSGRPKLIQSKQSPKTSIDFKQDETVTNEPDVLQKISVISQKPGVGMTQIIKDLSNNNQTIVAAQVQNAVKLLQEIKDSISQEHANKTAIPKENKQAQKIIQKQNDIVSMSSQLIPNNSISPVSIIKNNSQTVAIAQKNEQMPNNISTHTQLKDISSPIHNIHNIQSQALKAENNTTIVKVDNPIFSKNNQQLINLLNPNTNTNPNPNPNKNAKASTNTNTNTNGNKNNNTINTNNNANPDPNTNINANSNTNANANKITSTVNTNSNIFINSNVSSITISNNTTTPTPVTTVSNNSPPINSTIKIETTSVPILTPTQFVSTSISRPPSMNIAPSFLQTSPGSSQIALINSPSSITKQEIYIQPGVSSTGKQTAIISTPATALTNSQKQMAILNSIRSSEITQNSQQKSIQSIFFKLPGFQELDSIIISADSLSLLRIIQRVIQSDLNCQQKQSYLSDLLGRIHSAISMKAFAATQLAIIVQGSNIQIDRYTKALAQAESDIEKLGLQKLRDKLRNSLVALDSTYNKFNNADIQIPGKQAKIAGLKKDNQLLQNTVSNNKQALTLQQLKLNSINSKISQLENEFKKAMDNRNIYESNMKKLNESMKNSDLKIEQNKKKISDLDKQITRRQDLAEKLRNQYKILQLQILNKKTQITTKEKKLNQIRIQFPNLQKKAEEERLKMNIPTLNHVRSFIQNLQLILPGIKSKVDQKNYKCNQVVTIKPIFKSNKPVKQSDNSTSSKNQSEASSNKPKLEVESYEIPPKQYLSYVQQAFKTKPQIPKLQTADFVVTPLSILDSEWSTNYGNPYPIQNYTKTNQFTFADDFNCLHPQLLKTGVGIIKKIDKKFIEINDQASNTLRINLGACSRIQSIDQIPRIGQKLYFRGTPTKIEGQFNLYRGVSL